MCIAAPVGCPLAARAAGASTGVAPAGGPAARAGSPVRPGAGRAPVPHPTRSAIVVLLGYRPAASLRAADGALERELQSLPGLSLGILSAGQGGYTPANMLVDVERAGEIVASSGPTPLLTVYRLPGGTSAYAQLRSLVAGRPPDELIVVVQRARTAQGHELLWSAVAGLGRGRHTLTSATTEQQGMIAAMDVAPTLLRYLGLPIPAAMRGKPIRLDGPLDGAALRSLKARLEVVYPRRLPALACILAAWAALLLAARARRGWAWRYGALAMLWSPVALLLPAALEPGAAAEYVLIVGTSFALAALTDALIPWPRAPILPAAAAVLAIGVDALAGTQLLIRSLLGPNPAYGSRFYGVGNELKSGLAVLVLAAVAGALYPAMRSRRSAAAMAGAGALLAVVEGAARIGAGVGGVVLVCAGAAVASAMLLPGSPSRRRVLAVLAAPVVGLLLLAAIDLATAHGAGHFIGSVLDARSASDLQDLIVRRYRAAWHELRNGLMPLATAASLLLAAAGVRHRARLLSPVDSDPAWLAVLAGGLAGGLIGALVEDSGPVLLVVAVFALGCVLAYLWGRPLTQPTSRKGFSMRTEPIR